MVEVGYTISKNCAEIELILKRLCESDNNNVKGLILFSIFQKKILEDDYGAFENITIIKQIEESRNIANKHWEQAELNFKLNDNPAVIILSGSKSNMGTIIDVNYEIQQILGYHKDELINENIEIIMPEIIGSLHNFYIEEFYKNSKSSNINQIIEKLVFPHNNQGYIVPCYNLIRLMSNLENGVQLIGFLSLIKNLSGTKNMESNTNIESSIIMLLNEHYDILEFNKNITKLLFIEDKDQDFLRSIECIQKTNLKSLYPELFLEDNQNLMELPEGLDIMLNLIKFRNILSTESLDGKDNEYAYFTCL